MSSKRCGSGLAARLARPMGLGEATARRRAGDPDVPRDRFLWGPLAVNWAHQSLSYLDRGELVFRVLAEVISWILMTAVLTLLLPGLLLPLLVSAVLVHITFWIFAGNFWAGLAHAAPNLKSPSPEATARYLNGMAGRLSKSASITGVIVFGSLARGAWHDRSDVDLRVLRKAGLLNLLKSNALVMLERFRACWNRQPIDLFLADDPTFLSTSERPLFLVKRDPRLDRVWPELSPQTLSADQFRRDEGPAPFAGARWTGAA